MKRIMWIRIRNTFLILLEITISIFCVTAVNTIILYRFINISAFSSSKSHVNVVYVIFMNSALKIYINYIIKYMTNSFFKEIKFKEKSDVIYKERENGREIKEYKKNLYFVKERKCYFFRINNIFFSKGKT